MHIIIMLYHIRIRKVRLSAISCLAIVLDLF